MNKSEFGFKVSDDIVPIGDFKAQLARRLKQVNEGRRPLIVTQNGKPTAVVLSPAEFDRLTHSARFVAAVEQGLEQADTGELVSHEDAVRGLERRFGTLRKKSK